MLMPRHIKTICFRIITKIRFNAKQLSFVRAHDIVKFTEIYRRRIKISSISTLTKQTLSAKNMVSYIMIS